MALIYITREFAIERISSLIRKPLERSVLEDILERLTDSTTDEFRISPTGVDSMQELERRRY